MPPRLESNCVASASGRLPSVHPSGNSKTQLCKSGNIHVRVSRRSDCGHLNLSLAESEFSSRNVSTYMIISPKSTNASPHPKLRLNLGVGGAANCELNGITSPVEIHIGDVNGSCLDGKISYFLSLPGLRVGHASPQNLTACTAVFRSPLKLSRYSIWSVAFIQTQFKLRNILESPGNGGLGLYDKS